MLREYLAAGGEIEGRDDGPGFERWYREAREGLDAEREYQQALDLALVWRDRYRAGYQADYRAGYRAALERRTAPARAERCSCGIEIAKASTCVEPDCFYREGRA